MRKCEFTAYINGKSEKLIGSFHQWGTAFLETREDNIQYSTAIIEAEDGKVYEIEPSKVVFFLTSK